MQDTVWATRNVRNCGPRSGESINHKHLSDSHLESSNADWEEQGE